MKFKIEKTSDIYKITKDGIVMAECAGEDDAKRITACLEKFEGTDTEIIELIIRLIETERELEAAGGTIDMFMKTKTKIYGAELPDKWVSYEYSLRPLFEISRHKGGYVTIDLSLRIFNGGIGQPYCHAKSASTPEIYTGRGWKKRIIEDACSWLEKEMTRKCKK